MTTETRSELKQLAETARRAVDRLYEHLSRNAIENQRIEAITDKVSDAHCCLCAALAEINAITPETE